MIDREFDVRAYEEGYRAGKHDAQVEIDRLRDENERLSEAMAYWKVYDFTESKYLLCAQIERLRNEVSEWRKMDDEIRKFIGGKRDGRNTFDIVKERFNDAAFARSMADNLERLILKQNERLQTENERLSEEQDHSYRLLLDSYTHPIIERLQAENERLRAALEIAANDLDYCGACTDADNARAALGGDK